MLWPRCFGAASAEVHVVRTFSLQEDTHSALRIGRREHRHVALAVDVREFAVERRVFSLLCILAEHAEVSFLKLARTSKALVFSTQAQLMDGVGKNVLLLPSRGLQPMMHRA